MQPKTQDVSFKENKKQRGSAFKENWCVGIKVTSKSVEEAIHRVEWWCLVFSDGAMQVWCGRWLGGGDQRLFGVRQDDGWW